MRRSNQQLGPLRATVIDTVDDASPQALVVLCHGFGAPGTDLVGLGPEMASLMGPDAPPVRFIFPEGPLDLSPLGMWGARAWWQIDMVALQTALARGEPRVLAGEEPEGLAPARRQLTQLLEAALAQADLPMSRAFIGGFSQGAMLATDLCMRLQEAPAGLFICSGTLLAEKTWRRLAPQRRGMPTLVAHGRVDPILPFAGSEALCELLAEAGWEVRFLPFHGPHTISGEMVRAMAERVAIAARGAP